MSTNCWPAWARIRPTTRTWASSTPKVPARWELARIGVDNVTGSAAGDISSLAGGDALQSYRVAAFDDLAGALDRDEVTVLDVRQTTEFDDGHIRGALNIPLHELLARRDEVPAGEIWVHCGSGYRASIACSLIERADRAVVLIDDAFDKAPESALVS